MPVVAPTTLLDAAISNPCALSFGFIYTACVLASYCFRISLLRHVRASETDLFFLFIIYIILLRRTVFSLLISL